MAFRITGLSPEPFQSLFGLPDKDLASLGIKRYIVDSHPGFPDRIEMKDAQPGQSVLFSTMSASPPTRHTAPHTRSSYGSGPPGLMTQSMRYPSPCESACYPFALSLMME